MITIQAVIWVINVLEWGISAKSTLPMEFEWRELSHSDGNNMLVKNFHVYLAVNLTLYNSLSVAYDDVLLRVTMKMCQYYQYQKHVHQIFGIRKYSYSGQK